MDDELKISNLIFHIGTIVFSYFFSKTYLKNKKINYYILSFLNTFNLLNFYNSRKGKFYHNIVFFFSICNSYFIRKQKIFF